jgi:hypothetical protein
MSRSGHTIERLALGCQPAACSYDQIPLVAVMKAAV